MEVPNRRNDAFWFMLLHAGFDASFVEVELIDNDSVFILDNDGPQILDND